MEAPFKVGQRVVCVDDSIRGGSTKPSVVKDKVYTVKKCFPPMREEWGVSLYEVEPTNGTAGFLASRFRPLHYSSCTAELCESVVVGDTMEVKREETVK